MANVTIDTHQKVRIGGTTYIADAPAQIDATLTALPKQTTRMLRVECQHGCTVDGRPYGGRFARNMIDAGLAFCGLCMAPMTSTTYAPQPIDPARVHAADVE